MKLPKLNPSATESQKSLREKVFDLTPVVLTVIATVLAGLSSGELTRSQYYRSLASQDQSKASDQWSYFQAKRQRSVEADAALEMLRVAALSSMPPGSSSLVIASQGMLKHPDPQSPDRVISIDKEIRSLLNQPQIAAAFSNGFKLPSVTDAPIGDASVLAAMTAVDQSQTELQMAPLVRDIREDQIAAAMLVVQNNLAGFDAAVQPIGTAIDRLRVLVDQLSDIAALTAATDSSPQDIRSALGAVAEARFRFSTARYQNEANYNRLTGQILEIQVHRASLESDRHRERSNHFFQGMLVAQAGVLIATTSLAVRQRSTFWTLAALAGAAAAALGGYVYLFQ